MISISTTNKKNIGPETLEKEYKEIFLHCIEKYFSENDLINLVHSSPINQYKFNKVVSSTISSNIISYLPKYIGAYNNANQSNPADASQYWGSIAKFMMYNRVLSNAECLQIYNSTKARFGV